MPKPIQRPHPPIWVAASNFQTWEHAGKQGFGCIGVTRNTPEETKPFIDAYRAAITGDRSGFVARVPNNQTGAFAIGCVDKDDRKGRDLACAAGALVLRRERRRAQPRALQHRRRRQDGQ